MNQQIPPMATPSQPERRPWFKRSAVWLKVLIVILFPLALHTVQKVAFDHLAGDPNAVYVEDLDRDVDPRAAILKACPLTVIRVKHLEDTDVDPDLRYQSWSVDPAPGHVDRAWFDTKTGGAICP
ncbi:hypothetical protein GCM10027589_05400 [Actinocorallia lasiicapitis]